MLNLFRKPLFWTNVASLVFVGLVAFSVAHGWNNPTAAPVGGSGAISADASGNVAVGTAPTTDKFTVNGFLRFLSGGGLRFADGTMQTTAQRSAFFTPTPGVYGTGINSSAQFTFTAPMGVTTLYVTGSGGGGGGAGGPGGDGASAAGGGGGGGAAQFTYKQAITAAPGGIYTINVGRGGPGGAGGALAGASTGGSNGGNSSIVYSGTTLISLPCGNGGSGGPGGSASQYGTAGGGPCLAPVGAQLRGQNGAAKMSGTGGIGGDGGMNLFGIGGWSGSGLAGNPARGPYGAGGGGGKGGNLSQAGYAGGAGAPGFILLEW